MTNLAPDVCSEEESLFIAPSVHTSLTLPEALGHEMPKLLQRMFRDPRVLEQEERKDLIVRLRQAVKLAPHVPEVRVLLGMALCVDLQAQDALEELRTAAKQAPDCFIAHLKFGELLMRLRIVEQATEETQKAVKLAVNAVQSDLARKQATTIRAMMREGIERGGYGGLISQFFHFPRKSSSNSIASVLMGPK
jgi:hypothetical protein